MICGQILNICRLRFFLCLAWIVFQERPRFFDDPELGVQKGFFWTFGKP